MGKEVTTISPEGLEVANCYLQYGNIRAVCDFMGVPENQVVEVLNKRFGEQLDDTNLIFDLAKLEYISSAGLRTIFKTKKATAKSGGATFVVNPQPQVQKVFDIVKAMPGAVRSRSCWPWHFGGGGRSTRPQQP